MTVNAPTMMSLQELKAVGQIFPSLNFYQRLKVGPAATEDEIQKAFHREALVFHPDRYQGSQNRSLVEEAHKIYVKIVEAYRVLSNREKRVLYDKQQAGVSDEVINSSGQSGFQTNVTKKTTISGPGHRFFKLAQTALQSGDISSAKMNIQLALSMEKDNPDYKKFLSRLPAPKK